MENILELRNLTKSFGKRLVLNQLNFTFGPQCYGILGANGAGKTTLLRCITQHFPEGKEAVLFKGIPIKEADISLGYLPQHFSLFPELSVKDALLFLCSLRKMDKQGAQSKIIDILKLVNLEERSKDLVHSLSGGMLRRLGVAQTLLTNPDIILFDEPTAGLDPEERLRFHNLIRKINQDKLIIISSHLVEDLSTCCDQIIIMARQNIVASGTKEALVRQVEGKVYCLPEEREGELVGAYQICRNYEEKAVPMLRIVTNKKQNFTSVSPTLEDAYLFYSHE